MPVPHYRHRWADRTAQRTWCLACGCDRSFNDQHPDVAPAGTTSFNYHVALTRGGVEYRTNGVSPHGWPRGQGWCDRNWPAGWIPVNAPAGYVTPGDDTKEPA